MRSKKDKTAKKTAPTAELSATPKKRGRPSKADILARSGKIDGPVAQPEEKKKRGRPAKTAVAANQTAPKPVKLKKADKDALAKWDSTIGKVTQLASMGALHVKVDGIEVAFAPDAFNRLTGSNGQSYREDDILSQTAQMAKVAPMDNPDEYAEAQDRWVNHEPLPRI